jgi:antitoxin MazE
VKTRVQRWGNSLAIRIPKGCAEEVRVEQDTVVELSVEDGILLVRPVTSNRLTLEDLLAGISDDNIHGEVDFGPAVGNEVW